MCNRTVLNNRKGEMIGSYEVEIELKNNDESVCFYKALLENGMFGIDGAIQNCIDKGLHSNIDSLVVYLSCEGNLLNIWDVTVSHNTLTMKTLNIVGSIRRFIVKHEEKRYGASR